MKKVLKVGGLFLGVLLSIFLLFALYIRTSDIPFYEVKAPANFEVHVDSSKIQEGARSASMMCAQCHLSRDGKLGGALMPDSKEFGEIYAPNITQHATYGINDYSAGELAYLLRTGIKRDGQYAPPWMPKYPHLSDSDLNNILAFLRSDHNMVTPSENNPPKSTHNFLTKALAKFVFRPLPYPERAIPNPNRNDKIAFGKYLSTAQFDCFGCHSPDFKTQDLMVPENTPGYFSGGNTLLNLEGKIVLSSNLTMDKETGLGNWTEEEFIRTVKYGIRPNGQGATAYPMLPFAQMTDEEASAIWAYLKTVPVIRNKDTIE